MSFFDTSLCKLCKQDSWRILFNLLFFLFLFVTHLSQEDITEENLFLICHVLTVTQSVFLSTPQKNEGDLFHRLWHVMNEILDLRRQVLVGHLTHDRMKDVKQHITARLDWGNE